MKCKLLNVLTVCIVALIVLSPEVVVFSVVFGKHLELVKTQALASEINKTYGVNDALSSQQEIIEPDEEQVSIQKSNCPFDKKTLSISEQYQLVIILQWLFLLIPIFFGVGIIVYDRYLVYRATVIQEQVEMLERLWQQGIEQ